MSEPDPSCLARHGDFERLRPSGRSSWRPEHVGVWLERCYYGEGASSDSKGKEQRAALYEVAIDSLRPKGAAAATWRSVYARLSRELAVERNVRRVVEFEATRRILLHPSSNASVTDGAVLLHPVYGVPYLPGSGLKGLARAWMRRLHAPDSPGSRSDQRDAAIVHALFGSLPSEDGEHAGEGSAVEFEDALWIPEAPKDAPSSWSPLAIDVVNPHVGAYYTGGRPGDLGSPADWLAPTPTHRLTIAPGTRFSVAVTSSLHPTDAAPWVDYAMDTLLISALQTLGFGAWTSAGYGRLKSESRPRPQATPWVAVRVILDPGSGMLKATLPDGRRATVEGDKARALRAKLPEAAQQRLRAKRELSAKVRVEACGNAWVISDLQEK